MAKFRSAFTLIELMVVVAIIAILSTMGVANFSTAIKRSRNAVRQNDMIAVSKALETCYDVMGALYLKTDGNESCTKGGSQEYSSIFGGSSTGVFVADVEGNQDCQNRCLNANIVPTIANYNYTAKVSNNTADVQKYIVCAKLEKVGNVEGIGNSKDDLTMMPDIDTAIATLAKPENDCKSDTDCYFCVAAQQ